ncbi:MAG: hypothetical protein M1818_006573 [Claussenomyces sp. TS43310]|nr:MAG: hypothetical protein M1818_006573 [Claussenomyces sp. TS43310]
MSDVSQEQASQPVDRRDSTMDTFTLQIVSPSVEVAGPISFPNLPSETTIKQLKEKIRELVPSRPANEAQRLIHRGRMLAREDDTMAHVFGADTLKSSDLQTLHLVLKPPATESTQRSAQAAPTPSGASAGTRRSASSGPDIPPQTPILGTGPNMPPSLPLLASLQQHQQAVHNHQLHQLHSHNHDLQQQLLPSLQRLHELQQQGQRLHQELLAQQQRYQEQFGHLPHGMHVPAGPPPIPAQLALPHVAQRPPSGTPTFQNVVGQFQRDRAAMGLHGAQQGNGMANPQMGVLRQFPRSMSPMRQPDQSRTWRQEAVGPNGERWGITVNQTTTFIPTSINHQGRASPDAQGMREVQSMLRSGDRQLRQTTPNQGRSSPMVPSALHNSSPAPSSNTPVQIPNLGPVPAHNTPGPSSERPALATDAPPTESPSTAPVVYILSSPAGPRGLLINGTETFFTPRQAGPPQSNIPSPPNPLQAHLDAALGLPELRRRSRGRAQRHADRVAERADVADANIDPEPRGAPAAPRPNRQPADNIIMQMLPHLWLLVRLAGFVWVFVSADSSLWRWTVVTSLAVLVFLVNTGLLNGLTEDVWGPIRRHLEGLLPLAAPVRPPAAPAANPNQDRPANMQDQPPAAANTARPSQEGQDALQPMPAPEQVAARLLQERQHANGTWLRNQIRRAEHAAILFVASLIPGVGERHILARAEEEENLAAEAERQRREAQETTVPAASETMARTEGEQAGEAQNNA